MRRNSPSCSHLASRSPCRSPPARRRAVPRIDAPELARLGDYAVGVATLELVDAARTRSPPEGRPLVSRGRHRRRRAGNLPGQPDGRAAGAAHAVHAARHRRARREARGWPLPARRRLARLRQRVGAAQLAHGEPRVEGLRRRGDPPRGPADHGSRPVPRDRACTGRSTSPSSRRPCSARSARKGSSIPPARP